MDAYLCLAVLLTGHRNHRVGVPGGIRERVSERDCGLGPDIVSESLSL